MAIVDRSTLPRRELGLVQQSSHPVHLDHVMDVLLSFEALVGQLELLVAGHAALAPASLESVRSAALEAAAEGEKDGDECVGGVIEFEGLALAQFFSVGLDRVLCALRLNRSVLVTYLLVLVLLEVDVSEQ